MDLSKLACSVGRMFIKSAPEILMVTGIGCSVGAVGMAVKRGSRVEDDIDDFNFNCAVVRESVKVIENDEAYSEKECKKEVGKIKLKGYFEAGRELTKAVAKDLAPVIALEGASIGCCVLSNRLQAAQIDKLSRDLAAACASYVTLEKAFEKYRRNVRTKYGVEEDKLMKEGVIVKNKDGKDEVVYPAEAKAIQEDFVINKDELGYDLFWGEEVEALYSYRRTPDMYEFIPDPIVNYNTLKRIEKECFEEVRFPGGYISVNDIRKKLCKDSLCTPDGQMAGFWNDTGRILTDKELDNLLGFGLDDAVNYSARKGDESEWYIRIDPMGLLYDHIGPKYD